MNEKLKTTDEQAITILDTQEIPTGYFSLPTKEEEEFIDITAKEIIQSNFFGEKNVMAAKVKVRACLRLAVDPYLFYKHIQIQDFKGSKVLTQSAFLMISLALRSFPHCILKQGWVGTAEKGDLRYNILMKHPDRPPEPISFSLEEAVRGGYTARNKNYHAVPKDMVRARCRRRAVATTFPEVLGGIIYTPEDFNSKMEATE